MSNIRKCIMTKRNEKNSKSTVRIGPRISRGLYHLARYVYGIKGVNFEDQLEELVEKDLEYQMKQKWFLNATGGKEGEHFDKLRKAVSGSGVHPSAETDSDFYSNNINKPSEY
jgi:hypothetical protein